MTTRMDAADVVSIGRRQRRGARARAWLRAPQGLPLRRQELPEVDYKNPQMLKSFITDRGKIIPRRISGDSARQQRKTPPQSSARA